MRGYSAYAERRNPGGSPMKALEHIATIEVERQPDVDAADMAELLVRIDLRHDARRVVEMTREEG